MYNIHKILIIRFSSLGDIILSIPLVRQLRKKYPEAQLDFIIRQEYAELLRYHPQINTLIEFNTKDGIKGLKRLKKQIKKERYDVILDIHNSLRSRYLCLGMRWLFSGALVLKVHKQQFIRFLLVNFKINLYHQIYGRTIPVWEKYLRTAKILGVDINDKIRNLWSGEGENSEIYLSEAANNTARHMCQEKLGEDSFIAVAAGARHFTKRWPAEHYAELINHFFRKSNLKSVLIGGPEDVSISNEVLQGCVEEAGISLTGELSILETAAVIKAAKLLITNDSGLMHMGDAMGTPLIAIFGSTVEEFGFFPYHNGSNVIQNQGLSCRPCSHIGLSHCPKRHFRCMKEITPETIWNVAKQVLLNKKETG